MPRERNLAFVHIDVFARRPLEGNPLAVFPDAEGLSTDQMQTIAREMRLSETTFVLPREEGVEKKKGVRTRIFTVQEELPFAGHPTLGTAWVLRQGAAAGAIREDRVVLDLNVGPVPVRFSPHDDGSDQLFGEMTQPEPKWGSAAHRPDRVAAALGLEPSELDPNVPIETISTGNPFIIVPFRSLDTLRNLRPDTAKMQEYASGSDGKMFYLVCRETEDPGARLHARMIFYGGEDPATGSAAGPAAAWMLRHGWTKPEERVWIEQGLEILRPSQIFVRAGGTPERPTDVRVGGLCFGAIRGELTLPSST
jgi:trans-2,3-dihydro-3-hydroxyanthranilate isomerase